jgi:hypothetical protein
MNLAEITRLLVEAGADVNATANRYGGSTALGLLVTSDHPAKAGVTGAVRKVLEAAGGEARMNHDMHEVGKLEKMKHGGLRRS